MGLQDLFVSFPQGDKIYLAGLWSPGRATIHGADSPRDWDIRKGYGFGGATVVFTGNNVSKFSVEIALWDPLQWAEWQIFSKLLEKPTVPFQRPVALGIYHPILAAPPLNITEVVVENVTQFEQDDEGLWSCMINFIQYKKPLPMLGRPPLAIPVAPTKQPDIKTENEKMIASLLDQAFNPGKLQ